MAINRQTLFVNVPRGTIFAPLSTLKACSKEDALWEVSFTAAGRRNLRRQ
jgi:hypothetical protein